MFLQIRLTAAVLLLLFFTTHTCLGQFQVLYVDTNNSVDDLVENILVGSGIQVSNISYQGHPEAVGYFDSNGSNIGLYGGVLLSTGKVLDAPGPNETPVSDFGTEFGLAGHHLLTNLSGGITNDAAIIEFDFVSSSDSVFLQFVFASNEYMTFVGADFNDVFGLFISHEDSVNNAENIALIPGTQIPISIENINANVNDSLYVINESPPGFSIEYNGFTLPITVGAKIIPGQIYHAVFGVADVGDDAFDSTVFLMQQGFSSTSLGLSSNALKYDDEILVYPNPTDGIVSVVSTSLRPFITFLCQDFSGKTVLTGHVSSDSSMDISSLEPGMYLITLQNAQSEYSTRVVVR